MPRGVGFCGSRSVRANVRKSVQGGGAAPAGVPGARGEDVSGVRGSECLSIRVYACVCGGGRGGGGNHGESVSVFVSESVIMSLECEFVM